MKTSRAPVEPDHTAAAPTDPQVTCGVPVNAVDVRSGAERVVALLRAGEARDLRPIVRDEIYKVAAEALRNAYRHAEAGQIEAEIRYDDKEFRLRVRDDGKGIDPAVLASLGIQGHYGLRGMPERAALTGASWRCGAKPALARRWSCAFRPAPSMRRPSWMSRLFAFRTPAGSKGDVS